MGNELTFESKVMIYSFNPLGINQDQSKNRKLLEALRQQVLSV
jgi:hypothetical protein